jgi:hypothetical protein
VLGNRPVPYTGSASGTGSDPQILLKTHLVETAPVFLAASKNADARRSRQLGQPDLGPFVWFNSVEGIIGYIGIMVNAVSLDDT